MEQQEIVIQIANIEALERSTMPNCRFGIEGGSIGSSTDDHWSLYDKSGQVQVEHGIIDFIDGAYCIRQGNADVFVNKSNYPLGVGKAALLLDSDSIQIGKFLLRVNFLHDNLFSNNPDASLEEVVGDEEQTSLLIDENWTGEEKHRVIACSDPELALAESMVIIEDQDPEAYFDAQTFLNREKTELDDLVEGAVSDTLTPLTPPNTSVSFSGNKSLEKDTDSRTVRERVQTVKNDFSSKMEDLEDLVMGKSANANIKVISEQSPGSATSSVDEAGHLAASPLQRGLGITLKQSDSTQTHEVLEEIGLTLKEAVQGLLKIHNASKQQGISNKVLQPIEDNPMRLGLDYPETMAAMFNSGRSMVHLAAPMAIKESLSQIHLHQLATEHATKVALDAILQALNPATLSARFQRYRGTSNRHDESPEGWAWEMYKHYYDELISSRQQGFEKLYAEVFDQAYDQRLRELQNEIVNQA